ncbi:SGNH/GDSL hydrolase family protein [Streptomyces sp. NPDC002685]|uniref:SGNH/GDSL hydrolase family protein n=1 Tax=Streptomyces sp. NPDC002685 TaxID=3154540 RepID=UPI003320D57E
MTTTEGPTTEDADPHVLSPGDVDRLLNKASWTRFAVIGDSLAEGLGESSPGYTDLPWAERVLEALRRGNPGLEYRNLGVRHLKAAEVRTGQLQQALDFRPDLASVVCGGNDMLARDFSAGSVEAELDAMVRPLRESGADVFVFTIQDITKVFPEQLGGGGLSGRIQIFNDQVRKVAERHGALVIDMWSHPTSNSRTVFSADMLHASMRGHAVLASAVFAELGAHLAALHSR